MATNRSIVLTCALLPGALLAATAQAREASSPSACQSAASQPGIAGARSALDSNPDDLHASFNLADAWSDAGCFGEALLVLQNAQAQHPGNKELETRLRVAKSLIGEEHFFDNLDRANADAKTRRDTFRCTALSDVDACNAVVRLKPDDPTMLIAQGDALVRAKRPAEALGHYRRAASLAPNQSDVNAKIAAAEAMLPAQTAGQSVASGSAAPNATASVGAGPSTIAPGTAPPRATATNAAPGTAPPRAGANAAPATGPHPAVAARSSATAALQVARAPQPASTRRYSNTAPESQTH